MDQWPQPIVADLLGRRAFRLPDRADQLPWPQRRDDDRARLDRHALGHAIVERTQCSIEEDHAGAGHGPP